MTKGRVADAKAYDYDAQRWVHGDEARAVRTAQLREELAILEGPRGQEYCEMIQLVNQPRIVLAEQIQRVRAALEGGAR